MSIVFELLYFSDENHSSILEFYTKVLTCVMFTFGYWKITGQSDEIEKFKKFLEKVWRNSLNGLKNAW